MSGSFSSSRAKTTLTKKQMCPSWMAWTDIFTKMTLCRLQQLRSPFSSIKGELDIFKNASVEI